MIIRIKNTFPPPRVCSGCYWEALYKDLQRKHRRLRLELLTAMKTPARRGRPPSAAREEDIADDETPDLVDVLSAHG